MVNGKAPTEERMRDVVKLNSGEVKEKWRPPFSPPWPAAAFPGPGAFPSRKLHARLQHSTPAPPSMDTPSLLPQVEALADNIDDLEDALGPLLQSALSSHASKLPLLDKAKLYTLVTYAIESILFCMLWLHSVCHSFANGAL